MGFADNVKGVAKLLFTKPSKQVPLPEPPQSVIDNPITSQEIADLEQLLEPRPHLDKDDALVRIIKFVKKLWPARLLFPEPTKTRTGLTPRQRVKRYNAVFLGKK